MTGEEDVIATQTRNIISQETFEATSAVCCAAHAIVPSPDAAHSSFLYGSK